MSNSTFNDNLCFNVFEAFGVAVEDEDIKAFPLFSAILSDLCNRAKCGKAKQTDLEVEQAKQSLHEEKVSYDQLSIISSAVFQVVDENKGKKFTEHQALCLCQPNESKIGLDASSYLNMGLLNTHIPKADDADGLRCFGLTREFFDQHFQRLDKKFVDTVVIPRVTGKVLDFSRSVLTFQRQEFSESNIFDKVSQLPEILLEETNNLRTNRQKIQKEELLLNRQISYYFQCLMTAIRLLREKVELMKSNRDYCTSATSFCSVKCEALYLKARILQLQILNDTYNSETVLPLKTIKHQMQKRESNLGQDLMQKTKLLESYEAIGKTFQTLAEEFSEISAELKNEKWTLDLLKNGEQDGSQEVLLL